MHREIGLMTRIYSFPLREYGDTSSESDRIHSKRRLKSRLCLNLSFDSQNSEGPRKGQMWRAYLRPAEFPPHYAETQTQVSLMRVKPDSTSSRKRITFVKVHSYVDRSATCHEIAPSPRPAPCGRVDRSSSQCRSCLFDEIAMKMR